MSDWEQSEHKEDGKHSIAPTAVSSIKTNKRIDEDADEDVIDDWEASEPEDKKAKNEPAKPKGPIRNKVITKMKIAQNEAEERMRLAEQQALEEEAAHPVLRKKREQTRTMETDLENARGLFDDRVISKLTSSEDPLKMNPKTKADFEAMSTALADLIISKHGSKPPYRLFVEHLLQLLSEPLTDVQARKAASILTTISDEKQRALKDAKKGKGKQKPALVNDAGATASKERRGFNADLQVYDQALDDKFDVFETKASLDASFSDIIYSPSSPLISPRKKSSRLAAKALPESGLNAPPRKRLRAIENIPVKSPISKSTSHPQTLSKTLTSLCDSLAVRETPKGRPAFGKLSSDFSNVFSHARHLLSISSTSNVTAEEFLGRSKELSKLKSFLSSRYTTLYNMGSTLGDIPSSPQSGSLYISGPPGSGKTHMMKAVMLNHNHEIGRALNSAGIQIHFVNCVSLSASSGIPGASSVTRSNALDERLWNEVAVCLRISRSDPMNANYSKTRDLVEAHVMKNKIAPSIIILDEVDYLAASKLPLITPLLLLSQRSPAANFTVIGIANTLDLTTRFVKSSPFSRTNDLIEPELMHYSAFGPSDMVDIAKQRLKHLYASYAHSVDLDYPKSTPQKLFSISSASAGAKSDVHSVPLFHPAALQLCAKKVSSVTGDLRTFLSVLRKLIDSLEQTAIRNSQFLQQSTTGQTSVLDTPTKMRKFTRIISSSQLAPDLGMRSSENTWCNSRRNDPCNHLTPATAPKISPGDVVKYFKLSGVLDRPAFNTTQAECLKKLEDLNLHQSLVLVCLCVAWSREQEELNHVGQGIGRSKAYEVYRDCLKPGNGYRKKNTFNIGINPVSESEWADLLESGLQTRGLVTCLDERNGLSSHPGTPSATHNNQVLSPLKSPSKRKAPFQRSVLCTPSKLKPTGFNSPYTPTKSSPARFSINDRSSRETLVVPTHSISVLIQSIQSLANQTEATSDESPKFSPEIINILNQLLIVEEKRARVAKKRKAAEMDEVEAIGRKGAFQRDDDDEVEQENIVQARLVTDEDEGTCRD